MPKWTERQSPIGDEIFLDHLGYFADDLDLAGQGLARLGFQVSGPNVQFKTNPQGELVRTGTSNRLAMLEQGFLEVLSATSDTPLATELSAATRRYQGLHLIALTHPDMPGQRRRLGEDGFAMQPIIELRRWTKTSGGERQTHIDVLRTEPGQMAEGRVQLLTNHTPELFWAPGTTVHENRAQAVTGILMCVSDPIAASTRYARYTGRAVTKVADHFTVPLDRGVMVFVDPTDAARMLPNFAAPGLPYMAAASISSSDLSQTRDVLDQNGILPVAAAARSLWVGPEYALGSYLQFHSTAFSEVLQGGANAPSS